MPTKKPIQLKEEPKAQRKGRAAGSKNKKTLAKEKVEMLKKQFEDTPDPEKAAIFNQLKAAEDALAALVAQAAARKAAKGG